MGSEGAFPIAEARHWPCFIVCVWEVVSKANRAADKEAGAKANAKVATVHWQQLLGSQQGLDQDDDHVDESHFRQGSCRFVLILYA